MPTEKYVGIRSIPASNSQYTTGLGPVSQKRHGIGSYGSNNELSLQMLLGNWALEHY